MRGNGPDPQGQAEVADLASRELPDQIARVKATIDTARAKLAAIAERSAPPEPDDA